MSFFLLHFIYSRISAIIHPKKEISAKLTMPV
jgi:hypothetical protein